MIMNTILLTQCVRLLQIFDPTARRPLFPIARKIQERYNFLQGPIWENEYDLQNGITFSTGLFRENVIINKFQLYENGLLCETKVSSDVSDQFLEDVIRWGVENLGFLGLQQYPFPKAYLSQLEVMTDVDIADQLETFAALGQAVTRCLATYGQRRPDFRVSGIKLHADMTDQLVPYPAEFVFERRGGKPYSDMMYFSSAPLTTSDHLSCLNTLESELST